MFTDRNSRRASHVHASHAHASHAQACQAFGRYRGGGGFGRSGGDAFWRGDGSPFGRKLGADELQLLLLALLAENPAHGYELMRTIEERSSGFYKPSSGMVYPALTYLEEIGRAISAAEANRKLYSITEAGRAHLAEHAEEARAILASLTRIGGRMAEVRDAVSGLADGDPASGDDLYRARGAIKHALRRAHGCGPEATRRIARILEQAASDIDHIAGTGGQA